MCEEEQKVKFVVEYEQYDYFSECEYCRSVPCFSYEQAKEVAKNLSDRGFCFWVLDENGNACNEFSKVECLGA